MTVASGTVTNVLTAAIGKATLYQIGGDTVLSDNNNNTNITAVRLKVEQNQLVGVFGEIGVLVDGLKGA